MKKKSGKLLLMLCVTLLCTLFLSITALAAEEKGALTAVDGNHITGWLKDNAESDETAAVELHIYKDGAAKAAKVITVPEESYSEEAGKSYGDGCRAFDYKINWEEIGGSAYKVEACLVSGDEKTLLTGSLEYKPAPEALKKTESTSEEIGPGIPKKEEKPVEETFGGYKKGESLGIFKTTGYCGCSKCSGGSGLAYSGTVPQANHTISADITVLPLGTKVIIGETVYTVEDIGSGVDGHTVDLYFSSHQEALDYEVKKQEVFQAIAE